MSIVLVTGGVRCGKSEFAESLALKYQSCTNSSSEKSDVLYIATSKRDFGMESRINAHRMRRPRSWKTLESYAAFQPSDFEGTGIALLDCAGVMATNLMFEIETLEEMSERELFDRVWAEFDALLASVKTSGSNLIIVSNEVGWGLVSEHRLGNQFRDLLGAINKNLARIADEVYLLVAGIPLKIK